MNSLPLLLILLLSACHSEMRESYRYKLPLIQRPAEPLQTKNETMELAESLEKKHDFKGAIKIVRDVLVKNPGSRSALKILATSNLAIGNLTEASLAADKLVQLFPRTSTLSLRGLIYLSMGREEEGLYDLHRSLEIEDIGEESDSSWARCILGRYFISRGNLGYADTLISEAIRISPQSAFAMDLKAQLLAMKGKTSEAEKYFDKAFSESRQLVHMRHHAELNAQTNKSQLAIDRWNQVQNIIRSEMTAGKSDHRQELIKVLILSKSKPSLLEALELIKSELLIRQNAETFYLKALVHFELEQLPLATVAIEDLLRTGAREARYYELAGDVFQKLGNIKKAELFQKLTSDLNPIFNESIKFQ